MASSDEEVKEPKVGKPSGGKGDSFFRGDTMPGEAFYPETLQTVGVDLLKPQMTLGPMPNSLKDNAFGDHFVKEAVIDHGRRVPLAT